MLRFRCLLMGVSAMLLAGCRGGDAPTKALTGATLLDGAGKKVADAVVVVSGAEITAAGPRGAVTIPPDAARVDVSGKFIVPGLIDVRVKLSPDAALAREELHAFAMAGVTSVGVADGGPALDAITSARVLPAGSLTAGFAEEVISSGGNSPAGTFSKIERMAKAEIAPGQILTDASRNGAVWLKQERLGTVGSGKKADLLVLAADPSRDAVNLRKVERVMVDGKWLK